MKILKRYGLGINMAQLLENYWEKQKIVPKSGNFMGWPFGMGCGVTQGNPASPMIFNIVMDAVVKAVLAEVYGPQETHHGMGS